MTNTPPPGRLTAIAKIAAALVPALYLSRILPEFVWPSSGLLGLAGGLVVGGIVFWIRRRGLSPYTPTNWLSLFLLPYVLFPYQSPQLALACGMAFVVAWLIPHWRYHGPLVEVGVFVVAMLLFFVTLAVGVQPADAGEFQLVIADWGVAHPPGYPLHTVLGGLFARLIPFGDMASRVNLFSALTGALTLAIVCRTVRKETDSGWAGVIAAGALGVATTFWTTSTQASIRPMTALFAALMVDSALGYRRAVKHKPQSTQSSQRESQESSAHFANSVVNKMANDSEQNVKRALIYFGLAAGFGVTHHVSLFFPGIMLALAMWAARPGLIRQPRLWIWPILAGLAGAIPWGYLLLRGMAGDATLAPDSLATWDGFWFHVLAQGFAGDIFFFRTLPEIIERLGLIGQILAFQWHWLVLLLGSLTMAILAWRDRWLLFALGSAFGLHTFVAATYRAPQTVEYMIPAYVCLAVAVGWAIGAVGKLEPPRRQERQERQENKGFKSVYPTTRSLSAFPALVKIVSVTLPALAVIAILWSGWPVWISLRAYQGRDSTATNSRALLDAAPQNSIVLANWHHATPLWALQADGLRPDVEVRYIFPEGAESVLDKWTRLISEGPEDNHPLIACSLYPELFRHTGQTLSALESCWQVGASPMIPGNALLLAQFDGLTLFSDASVRQSIAAGETIRFSLNWYISGEIQDNELVSFAHLVNAEGIVLAQDDQPLSIPGVGSPRVVAQSYTLIAPRTVAPGTYQLLAGVYRRTENGPVLLRDENGDERVAIAPIVIQPARLPPVTNHETHTPFGGNLVLLGYDYDLSVPGRARLYLHWQAREIVEDDLSLRIHYGTGGFARAALPMSQPGFLTTTHDLPDVETVGGVWLRIERGESNLLFGQMAWGLPFLQDVWLPGPQPGELYIPVGEVIVMAYFAEQDQESGEIRATVTIRSATAITQDISFKLALGELAQVDVTPVGNAIPTLKWGWGATLTDTLRIPWSEGIPWPEHFEDISEPLTLTLYDAFTSQVWPVFDPAYIESGPGLLLTP